MVTNDLLALMAMCLVVLYIQKAGSAALSYRGTHVITCPGTGQPAAVEFDGWRTVLRPFLGRKALRVHRCSVWPERRNCDQACVGGIAASPKVSLVPNILTGWYRNRVCVCCGAPFGEQHAGMHQPCLLSPEGKMLEWKEVPPQNIPKVLETAGPVCWTCLMAETHTW